MRVNHIAGEKFSFRRNQFFSIKILIFNFWILSFSRAIFANLPLQPFGVLSLHFLFAVKQTFDGSFPRRLQINTVENFFDAAQDNVQRNFAFLPAFDQRPIKRRQKQISEIENQNLKAEESFSPKTELFPGDIVDAHLEKISLELKSAKDKAKANLRSDLEKVLIRLTELRRKSHAAENLEDALEKLDALVDESLLRNYETEKLKGEIEKQIASYKNKMEREVYQRTFDLMLLKRLREQAEIPRLSLFNL